MSRFAKFAALAALAVGLLASASLAQDAPPPPDPAKTPAMLSAVTEAKDAALQSADTAWILTSAAFVMLMLPGLALFYGGMARRKNVLGTMMHTMVALGIVGVQWVVIGYALAFGDGQYKVSFSKDAEGKPIEGSVIGFSKPLMFLSETAAVGKTTDDVLKEKGIVPKDATDEQKADAEKAAAEASKFKKFPNTKIPLYLHAMFQGMFAIITVALVSGAFAERVKFFSYCLFAVLWTTIVYDPLAHMVWSATWDTKVAAGLLGVNGAIDFAGGTVVHIAAGFSGLAAILCMRRRIGYGKHTFHPNSMVLTLLGAGLLWFGWFGFNGGSALFANGQAVSAFAVTQTAAAMAGITWTIVEWIHKGKPTALGFASGLVAGLVAITPASGYVAPTGALIIGLAAGVICYLAVMAKGLLGYDDSLDAFGVHGVGGLLGAILTGVLVSLPLWAYGAEMAPSAFPGKLNDAKDAIDYSAQIKIQIIASVISAVYAFVVTCILVLAIEYTIGFTVTEKDEQTGLDLSQHGETGFDYGGGALDELPLSTAEPKKSAAPPNGANSPKRFTVVVDGPEPKTLIKVWSDLCKTNAAPPSAEFKAVYPFVTTVSGNKFRFRGGDPTALRQALERLFANTLNGTPVKTYVET